MKDVGGRRVVHDDDLVQVTTQATQVLHIVSSMKDTGLSEEATAEGAPFVQEVRHRVSVLQKSDMGL